MRGGVPNLIFFQDPPIPIFFILVPTLGGPTFFNGTALSHHTFELVQVFESLSLMHVCMEWEGAATQQRENINEASHTILTVTKHQSASWVTMKHVIHVQVLCSKKYEYNAQSFFQLCKH